LWGGCSGYVRVRGMVACRRLKSGGKGDQAKGNIKQAGERIKDVVKD